jgi:NitT/TauT family transport system permease protein
MLFTLRGKVERKTALLIQWGGFVVILFVWEAIGRLNLISSALLPTPTEVVSSFGELFLQDGLLGNLWYSIYINLLGYAEAIAFCIPVGFAIGLFPFFREMFKEYLGAVRFLPLTAITGLFIAWFGIMNTMKVQFLAFGISVYLLPVVVQRVQEVDDVYVEMAYTLGANKWQTIKSIFIPAVLAKISDDIRVLVAISWTYIIVAEMINKGNGGIGALAYTAARQSRVDKVFGILAVIIVVGMIQDKLAILFDKWAFKFKHLEAE